MKKYFLIVLCFFTLGAVAQDAPLSPKVEFENDFVSIDYSAPSVRGRVVFGDLVPYDVVWRTGANQATKITFKKDVNFGGAAVEAGSYSLFTIPGEREWTVILNSDLTQWGAFGYDEIKEKNVAEVKVTSRQVSQQAEKLLITHEGDNLIIHWDKTEVRVPLKF